MSRITGKGEGEGKKDWEKERKNRGDLRSISKRGWGGGILKRRSVDEGLMTGQSRSGLQTKA